MVGQYNIPEKIFTGVGARNIPKAERALLYKASLFLCSQGWGLRSGGADGSDSVCEAACDAAQGKKSIYLPWPNFNASKEKFFELKPKAFTIASTVHPKWNVLRDTVRKLHARNVYQILGFSLDRPSDIAILYTKNGETVGGTATAIRLAEEYNVPIFNFGKKSDIANFENKFKINIRKK